MASVLPANNLCTAILPCKKIRFSQPFQVKAQSHRDHEGRSSDVVDANLHLLRVRIEEARNKERLERCCLAEQGWNYAAYEQNFKSKRDEEMLQFLQLLGVVGATFGLTILSCSFCLCIFSLVVHLNQ